MLDLTQTKDSHIDQRLRQELIIWLGSVKSNGNPHLVPVWFLWDGNQIIILSQPGNQKIRNIQHNSHVTLALEAVNDGDDIVMLDGEAKLVDTPLDEKTLLRMFGHASCIPVVLVLKQHRSDHCYPNG
ncbi:hypothetical protein KDW_16490 [Dictyobacter vulcani]|uniref:Pyridoxamine 5'-phosphate oxidase N-terminal domain-containing protein n=1 Tax=Dictyobacter vulcani TaxID=2607529 RepID=A0A5J4KM31_9CHLR|nr:pyridoxamine 5'-phosphate oxidase family protein [Dictyobacter vulcani]GER87487.1 hypothetical protein KDW_16490 [Dictyobacter vulcani]